MNYIQKVRRELQGETECTGALLDLYTLLVFTKGENCTLEDVHDAWAIWRNDTYSQHKALVPFNELTIKVQELDRYYTESIIKVAKKFGIKS